MLSKLLGSALRAKVLGWLLAHPEDRFFGRQLETVLGEDSTNISRELAKLAGMGILTSKKEGRQKYYQANAQSPIYPELRGLILKTVGLVDVLRDALGPLTKKISVAFVYGSMAGGEAGAKSDVDLMVVGDITLGQVVKQLAGADERLGREVNPTVYRPPEFGQKVRDGHHFLTSVMREPRMFVIGDEDDLRAVAEKRLA